MTNTDKKIRVCFISPKAYPIFNPEVKSVFGGAEVDTCMIATELAKDEAFVVSFIVADYGQPQEEVRENVRILKGLDFRQNPLVGARKIWNALKQADADVYMMKTASPGVPLVQYFCRRHNRRFIYKTANQGECDGSYLRDHPILGRLFIRSLKKAAQVITQNQQDHDNLKQRFDINSVVIPNGHRIPETVQGEKQTILWVGRSAAVKGPQRFLELAKQFPGEPFVMICQRATGDTQYDELIAAATKIGNLEFLERVPFGEIDSYFKQAKVFANTSDSEGFPNTFIQACKTATAILSFGVNPDNFIGKHHCGLTCDFSQEKMTENLKVMLQDEEAIKFGQNGRSYVEATHDIVKIIERYKDIFRE
ncbi:MAG: glycosyltransferase family 4 protein [Planctomycetota bacterium]|jgi:glycosyltransferase involved in cell wall biosynthesis